MINKSIEILIPAHNELENITMVVEKCLTWLKKYTENYRILIVDDGSDDGTQEVLLELNKKYPEHIGIIYHPINLGIGQAWRTLYNNCNGDIIFTCPADGQFDPKDFTQSIPYLKDADVISFYRIKKEGYSLVRNIISIGNRIFNIIFFGLNIKDINWMKMYKLDILKDLDLKSKTSLLETEIIAKAKKRNKKIIELPSKQYLRVYGESEGSGGKNLWQVLKDLINVFIIVKKFK